jgi:hypothetical protein
MMLAKALIHLSLSSIDPAQIFQIASLSAEILKQYPCSKFAKSSKPPVYLPV